MFLIFLDCVKITSTDIKLDRQQLQHWLLFLEHNRSENADVAAGLPVAVPIGYDYVYNTPPVLLILSDAGSSPSRFETLQSKKLNKRVGSKQKFSILQSCNTGMQATHKTSLSTCNVLLSSFLLFSLLSNGTTAKCDILIDYVLEPGF